MLEWNGIKNICGDRCDTECDKGSSGKGRGLLCPGIWT